jgi:hypothetical protein
MKKIAISVLALTLAVFLATPAMAAKIEPYASMRLGTFYSSVQSNVSGVDDNNDLNFDLADISRFGARGQVGDIYGVAELGLRGSKNDAGYGVSDKAAYYNRQVYTRLLYGKWDFGAGDLIVGQDYTPITYPSAQQAPGIFNLQNGFISTGCMWDRRWPQVKVNLDNGLVLAAVETYAGTSVSGYEAPPAGTMAGGNYDVTVPKLYIAYKFKREGIFLSPGFGYNVYNYNDKAVGGTFDDDISSYVVYLQGKWDPSAVGFKFAAHYGENINDFGILGRPAAAGAVVDAFNEVQNATSWGGYIQVAVKVDPTTISLGWGYANDENDAVGPEADEKMGIFVNCKVPIAETFFITPEFSWWDGMDNAAGVEDADSWHLGITWQMDF